MAIEWKTNRTWKPERNRQAETWKDGSGVEWDSDYVTRFERLQSALKGSVICAWHSDYEETRRIWLGGIEKWPAVMVLCLEDEDIETCCAFANTFNLPITLRVSNHFIKEEAVEDGAMVIDMSLVS